jgi:hypothetical protein
MANLEPIAVARPSGRATRSIHMGLLLILISMSTGGLFRHWNLLDSNETDKVHAMVDKEHQAVSQMLSDQNQLLAEQRALFARGGSAAEQTELDAKLKASLARADAAIADETKAGAVYTAAVDRFVKASHVRNREFIWVQGLLLGGSVVCLAVAWPRVPWFRHQPWPS